MRADLQDRPGLRRSAGAPSRHGDADASSEPRRRRRGRLADQYERACEGHPPGDAGGRSAYRGGVARRRLQRGRYRRDAPERSGVMDALTGNAPPREYAGGKMLSVKEGGIGFITFNQPEKRNAMSVEMWQGMEAIRRRVPTQGAGG